VPEEEKLILYKIGRVLSESTPFDEEIGAKVLAREALLEELAALPPSKLKARLGDVAGLGAAALPLIPKLVRLLDSEEENSPMCAAVAQTIANITGGDLFLSSSDTFISGRIAALKPQFRKEVLDELLSEGKTISRVIAIYAILKSGLEEVYAQKIKEFREQDLRIDQELRRSIQGGFLIERTKKETLPPAEKEPSGK